MKTKLTPETQAKICGAIRAGMYFEEACAVAGVEARTGYLWLQIGRGEHPTRKKTKLHEQFVHAYTQASAEAEQDALGVIRAQSHEDWRAAAWWLERRFPNKWGKRIEASGDFDMRVVVEYADSNPKTDEAPSSADDDSDE